MTSLPKIAPLVVTPRAAAFDNPNWRFELKYEGFRALLEIDSGGARPPAGCRSETGPAGTRSLHRQQLLLTW